jgi:hypothetical protein
MNDDIPEIRPMPLCLSLLFGILSLSIGQALSSEALFFHKHWVQRH